MSIEIKINPRDIAGIKELFAGLSEIEIKKSTARGINKTLTGVRTDATKILTDQYALTAKTIRESFTIRKAAFKAPHGTVSTRGTFIRLMAFGARQTKTGVSVKVLKAKPRAIIRSAFIARLGVTPQLYWRKYKGTGKKPVPGRAYAKMPLKYRLPVESLYGPRIQDHLGDPRIMKTLEKMAGDRLSTNMEREVNFLIKLATMPSEVLE